MLRPGQRFHSAVCDAQVVVVKPPDGDIALGCGGAVMLEEMVDGAKDPADETLGESPQLGKRYVDEETGLEVLCTRAGVGALTADGRLLGLKDAKPLPASD